jgi:glycine dehydrogenase subunit 2
MKKPLEPFRPIPVLVEEGSGQLALEYDRPQSIGRIKAFSGNFGVLVRALAYILAYGRRGRSKWKFQLTRVVIARSVALA